MTTRQRAVRWLTKGSGLASAARIRYPQYSTNRQATHIQTTMAFDPTKPAPGDDLDAEVIRAQLNALKESIDSIPAGPAGPVGPSGPPLASIQITGVTTGEPGTAAAVSAMMNAGNVELTFTIPRGEPGASGVTSTDVTNAITNERINNAQNPTSVQTLSLTLSDPPTLAEVQAVLDKVNELITALQRQP